MYPARILGAVSNVINPLTTYCDHVRARRINLTKNYCVTLKIRAYANFISNLLAYVINAVSP